MGEGGSIDDDDVLTAVRSRWQLTDARLEPLAGGMNSGTSVAIAPREGLGGLERWVAKLVRPDQRDSFTRGLAAAAVVEAAGTPAGRPLMT